MEQRIEDVMTPYPKAVDAQASVKDAAAAMRHADVGDVVVLAGGTLYGILTDRDIAVRVVAIGRDPSDTEVGEICSTDVAVLSPGQDAGDALRRMQEQHVRRLPVVVDGQPIGIVSLGDLAVRRDAGAALADISSAPPSR